MRLTEAEKANIHSALRPHTRPGIGRVEALGDLTAAVERILDARSADMEAQIRAVRSKLDECDRRLQREPDRVLQFWVREVRALLDAAPAGGAECACPRGLGHKFHRYPCPLAGQIDAPSEVPHD